MGAPATTQAHHPLRGHRTPARPTTAVGTRLTSDGSTASPATDRCDAARPDEAVSWTGLRGKFVSWAGEALTDTSDMVGAEASREMSV